MSKPITHFLAKTIFSRSMGMYIILVEIPEGWGGGGVFWCSKKWKFQGGGVLFEIPSVVGLWIFSGTTHKYNFPQASITLLSHSFNLSCASVQADKTKTCKAWTNS